MGYGTIIGRRGSWADESLANIDRADWHRLARSIGISRTYNVADSRQISWRYARGKSQRPNYVHNDEAFENRSANWDKETREFADQLRQMARRKHDYVAMPTGYCLVCGEREYARISETSYGVTVWRLVHTNPKLLVVNTSAERGEKLKVKRGKPTCEASGWSAPAFTDPGDRIICSKCGRNVLITSDGMIRRHFSE